MGFALESPSHSYSTTQAMSSGSTPSMKVTHPPPAAQQAITLGVDQSLPPEIEVIRRERMVRADEQALAYSKDEFLAVVTHELRSPLNAIKGWAHVLRQGGNLSPLQLKALDAIDRNTLAQTRLVDDLLDSQRVLCNDLRLVLSPVSLAALINQVVDTVRPSATARQIDVSTVHDPALDTVSVDAARLSQALVNVLNNAIKFSQEHTTVTVRTRHYAAWVLIEVNDEGHGLSEQDLLHVFDRFQRSGSARTRDKSGLGLGLSLASQLIKLHGGDMEATSAGPGLGSTFTIRLPAHLAEDLPPASDETSPAASLRGRRVVLVDDDDDAREIMELVLRDAQVELKSFSRSAEAYDYLVQAPASARPDALISDIAMPDEDGYAFMQRLRALEAREGRPRLLALAVTAFSRIEDQHRAHQAGFDHHLPKPFEARAVLRTLATALASPSVQRSS